MTSGARWKIPARPRPLHYHPARLWLLKISHSGSTLHQNQQYWFVSKFVLAAPAPSADSEPSDVRDQLISAYVALSELYLSDLCDWVDQIHKISHFQIQNSIKTLRETGEIEPQQQDRDSPSFCSTLRCLRRRQNMWICDAGGLGGPDLSQSWCY